MWQQREGCTLILNHVDVCREEEGEHWISRELADTYGIPLDPSLIGRALEYTLTHRMLTGERVPTPVPREATEPEAWLHYSDEAWSLKPTTVLLSEIQRLEVWSWLPDAGYAPGEPLHHRARYVLWVNSWSDFESSPVCSLTVELTPEEYDACTKLLPGSIFDLTLRLVPMREPAYA